MSWPSSSPGARNSLAGTGHETSVSSPKLPKAPSLSSNADQSMTEETEHSARVDAWMARALAPEVPLEGLVPAFEAAFGALWQRAHLTLGKITLTAMVDRVLHTAAARFPFLGSLEVQTSGLRCEELRRRAHELPRAELALAIRFVLVELLTVLGNLTAEILSPALHVALSQVALGASDAAGDAEGQLEPAARESAKS